MNSRPGAGGGCLLFVAVAAFFGGRLFLVAVLVLAAVALVEMSRELGRRGPRPVVAAAAVAGLGAPLWVGLADAEGAAPLPAAVVAMVLVAFVLMIVTGRRQAATATLGATMLCGLLTGLGAGALVAVEALRGGERWIIGLVAVAAVAVLAAHALRPDRLAGTVSLRLVVALLAAAPAVYLLAVAVGR